jgi:hypothetical protein
MSLRKRLRRIEISLKPLGAVLLWLKEMLDFGQERYWEEVLADPRNPRNVVAKMVGEAVRKNFIHPMQPELVEQAVREAQKQADMLIMLILQLHDYVRSECKLHHLYGELLDERLSRILGQSVSMGRIEPKPWELWRALLRDRLIATRSLRKIVQSISAKYYEGHPLLFAADEDVLNSEIACLEDLMKEYNCLKGVLPDWKAIDLHALSSEMERSVELQVEHLVTLARAKTLSSFGEEQAARELLDSTTHVALRELERLRSLSSRQDNLTS